MCVRNVDVQCVLQFTLLLAVGCVLHRPTSRVIHRSELSFFAKSTWNETLHGIRESRPTRAVGCLANLGFPFFYKKRGGDLRLGSLDDPLAYDQLNREDGRLAQGTQVPGAGFPASVTSTVVISLWSVGATDISPRQSRNTYFAAVSRVPFEQAYDTTWYFSSGFNCQFIIPSDQSLAWPTSLDTCIQSAGRFAAALCCFSGTARRTKLVSRREHSVVASLTRQAPYRSSAIEASVSKSAVIGEAMKQLPNNGQGNFCLR